MAQRRLEQIERKYLVTTAYVKNPHQRWAIEQQYQELETELGLDHFKGRSYPGCTIT
jgi:SRSO17 transposase